MHFIYFRKEKKAWLELSSLCRVILTFKTASDCDSMKLSLEDL